MHQSVISCHTSFEKFAKNPRWHTLRMPSLPLLIYRQRERDTENILTDIQTERERWRGIAALSSISAAQMCRLAAKTGKVGREEAAREEVALAASRALCDPLDHTSDSSSLHANTPAKRVCVCLCVCVCVCVKRRDSGLRLAIYNTLQHVLQRAAAHFTAHYNTHCSTLQHILQHTAANFAAHCNIYCTTLQQSLQTHCNTNCSTL